MPSRQQALWERHMNDDILVPYERGGKEFLIVRAKYYANGHIFRSDAEIQRVLANLHDEAERLGITEHPDIVNTIGVLANIPPTGW